MHTAGRILCFISSATVRCLLLFTLSGTLALDLEESSGDGVEARRDQTLRPDDQGDAIVVVLSSRGGHYQQPLVASQLAFANHVRADGASASFNCWLSQFDVYVRGNVEFEYSGRVRNTTVLHVDVDQDGVTGCQLGGDGELGTVVVQSSHTVGWLVGLTQRSVVVAEVDGGAAGN